MSTPGVRAPAAPPRTFVDDCCEYMVPPVQPHVQGEHEAHDDLICKHNNGLNHVERVACEGRRRGGPVWLVFVCRRRSKGQAEGRRRRAEWLRGSETVWEEAELTHIH